MGHGTHSSGVLVTEKLILILAVKFTRLVSILGPVCNQENVVNLNLYILIYENIAIFINRLKNSSSVHILYIVQILHTSNLNNFSQFTKVCYPLERTKTLLQSYE